MKIKLLYLSTIVVLSTLFSNAQEQVIWQDTVGITIDNYGSVTGRDVGSYGSYAYSIQSIKGFQDGYFEFINQNVYGMVGLSSSPIGGGYQKIDYALQLRRGDVAVVENGTQKGVKSTSKAGDKFKIEIKGDSVFYYKNGTIIYNSQNLRDSEKEYHADFAFGGKGYRFEYPIMKTGGDFWVDTTNVSVGNDGSITGTSNASYASHAYSKQSIKGSQDGYFEFTNTSVKGLIGLSSSPIGGGFNEIDYALQVWFSNELNIVENGSQTGYSTTWTSGDKFKIEIKGDSVFYHQNDVIIYKSKKLRDSQKEYHADFAFGGIGATFNSPVINVTSIITSLFTKTTSNQYFIFPNPSSGVINIPNLKGEVEILSTNGNVLMTTNFTEELHLDHLENGVYFIKIKSDDDFVETHRIVITK